MARRKGLLYVAFFCLICLLTSAGCSGAQETVTPPTQSQQILINSFDPEEGGNEAANNRFLWGLWLICVDPEAGTSEIVPVRLPQTHWNVLNWLEQGPCTDCFQLVGLGQSGSGTLLADVEITHPFDNPNLTGFDVRGIAMFNASRSFPASALTISDRSLGDGELVNADGYTTLYNSTTAGSGPEGLQGYLEGDLATSQAPDGLLRIQATYNG